MESTLGKRSHASTATKSLQVLNPPWAAPRGLSADRPEREGFPQPQEGAPPIICAAGDEGAAGRLEGHRAREPNATRP